MKPPAALKEAWALAYLRTAVNLANADLGSNATAFGTSGVGRGTYFVRIRAKNTCGTGAASNEVVLVVP